MPERTGIFEVDEATAEQTAAEYGRQGWRVYRLPVRISSKAEFFAGVRKVFPLDPELRSDRSWDALADSLWAGLDALADARIVVIWPDASHMKMHAPEDFEIARDVFAELPKSLADREATGGRNKEVLILQGM